MSGMIDHGRFGGCVEAAYVDEIVHVPRGAHRYAPCLCLVPTG